MASSCCAAAKVASTEVWRGEGARTAEEWLAGRTGTTPQAARHELDTARRLERLPATAAAVQQGRLSPDQAAAIADAASVDPSAEGGLLSSAGRGSLRDLKDRCARTKANADPDPEATVARIRARRTKRCWTDAEGVGHLHLSGLPAVIARMDNAISHRADRIFRDARKEGRREPPEAYAFDAAEQLLTRRGDGADVPAGADAKIIVRVDHGALQRGHAIDGEVCEIAGRGPIDVGTVREWLEDAFVAALATDGVDVTKVVHLGRRFTALQRTVLQWQDPVCARRGCNNRLGLEYDHFEDWADTRTTRTGSAKRFCRACHRLKTIGWHVPRPDPTGSATSASRPTTMASPGWRSPVRRPSPAVVGSMHPGLAPTPTRQRSSTEPDAGSHSREACSPEPIRLERARYEGAVGEPGSVTGGPPLDTGYPLLEAGLSLSEARRRGSRSTTHAAGGGPPVGPTPVISPDWSRRRCHRYDGGAGGGGGGGSVAGARRAGAAHPGWSSEAPGPEAHPRDPAPRASPRPRWTLGRVPVRWWLRRDPVPAGRGRRGRRRRSRRARIRLGWRRRGWRDDGERRRPDELSGRAGGWGDGGPWSGRRGRCRRGRRTCAHWSGR